MQKFVRPIVLGLLLLFAAYVRVTGLGWGLASGYGHDRNFQPDEFISLRGVLQVDLLTGRLRAPGAYFEGTFNYYLWAVPQAVLRIYGSECASHTAAANTRTEDHSNLLYICRWMSVFFDVCTIVIVFFGVKEATRRFYPSVVGALCYAILPMQVIYAHFMRTHILSNLLCALVIWLSLRLRKSQRWYLLLTLGFISGLGAAARYPVGIIVVIPLLYLLCDGRDRSLDWKLRLWERARKLIRGPVWWIGCGFVVGLFLGHPMLFLDPSSVTRAITGETLKYASLQEFRPAQLVNLSVVWKYITYLIPLAMYPLLWLVPYCAILWLLFRRRLYSQSAPLLIFSVLYLYFMGKGYLGPYFARATMLLFPGFCVLSGIAYSDLQLRLRKKPTFYFMLVGALILVLAPSAVFDMAYDDGMQRKDARVLLQEDLQRLIGEASATIGVSRLGSYFYTVMPAAQPLKSGKVTVQLQDDRQQADYFLMGFPAEIDPTRMNATIRQVEAHGKFRYEKAYNRRPKMFGYEFGLRNFPADMTYPFPAILLFQAAPAKSEIAPRMVAGRIIASGCVGKKLLAH